MAAAELASIVAAYLRKHGFAKSLAAFSREAGDMVEERDIVDLETLFKLYTSTLVNGDTKTKKSRKSKLEHMLEVANGNENSTDNAEEKVNKDASSEKVNKDSSSERKKKKNLVVSPVVSKSETENVLDEGSKKKKEKNPEKGETLEVLKPKVENCSTVAERRFENGGELTAKQEDARSPKSLTKRSKKEKKEQEGEQLVGSETPCCPADNTQISSQEDGLSKKKRKKSKDVGGEERKDAIATESACENGKTEKFDAMKQPVELLGEPEKCETSSKKKKKRKELLPECEGAVNGSLQEPPDAKLEASKNEEGLVDGKKQSSKKRKHKEDTSLVNGITSHDQNSPTASPEKNKGGVEVVHECDVEIHESDSTKTKKRKETADNKKTPTGALAFKRVEEDKVTFSDPRLRDNSYWAKDGADEGYGAKAQEVLGLVRGRDFRHEKTKKKRGSYRGGVIGFESHSIKFENSDEE